MNVILYGVCSGTLKVFQAVIVKYFKKFFYFMKQLKAFAKAAAMCVALVFCAVSANAQTVINISAEAQEAVNRFFGVEAAKVYQLETSDLQEIGKFLVANPGTICLADETSWEEGDSLFVRRTFIGLTDKEARKLNRFILTEKELSSKEMTRRQEIDSKIVDLSDESTVKEEIIAGGEARVGNVAFPVYEDGSVDASQPIELGAKNIYYWQVAPVVGINYDFDGQWTPYFGAELARWGRRFGGYIQGKLGWAYYPETAERPGKSYLTGGAQIGLGTRLWANGSEDKSLWIGPSVGAMWYSTDTKRPEGDEYRWATQDGVTIDAGAYIKWRMPFFELSLNYSYTKLLGYDMAEWHHNIGVSVAVPFSIWRNSTAK